MKLLNFKKFAIIRVIGLLLILLAIGCGKKVVNNGTENRFDGIWEMEYNASLLSNSDPDFGRHLLSVAMRSVVTFVADSFNIQIIAPNSYQYLNIEYAGNYSISADTIIFNVKYSLSFNEFESDIAIINNDLDFNAKMQFSFNNQNSLKFSVIFAATSGNFYILPRGSFLWNARYDWGSSFKNSGNYSRIDID